ncbi:xanthine dehydrogenase family protein molybdopterin-binding subunit [Siccirubricoccus sp. KC 17139]|uniref:Xanthine dehydrogenase family protein molybdopterin-binding subunit n=1 Tax=Siccirubricoccus soli TaxID=2899147 RepID=A0ABT1DD79_9PROT|nr:xanthine dehydrogenase family protein molybdopterin-binding subunit [Siccirubricoccus soli]MCO6419552.1 xanthine dehydrogenase family protein molybdopterin-binding subunit [Siccirubricoccus soli]MCP2685687.1 xanthine dehydrogenase family protein molybdopterin-binding subunit [Siccirubricoccus soli]
MPDGTHTTIGQPAIRIDGRAKVTGMARYASDEVVANPAHAFLVTSAIARGRVRGFRLEAARAVPGVLDILTHENVGGEAEKPQPMSGGDTTTTLESDRIWHDGQIIALVLAESFEAAREAAHKVEVDYEAETPAASFGSPGAEEEVREAGEHKDYKLGDAAAAFAAAEVKVDARYGTPTQHHNPIELYTTTCEWRGGKLTVYESSQFVYGLRASLAKQLRMDPGDIHVVSRFVGGAFGSRGGITARTAWVAVAARRLNRPVRLVPTRDQGFTIVTYRAETRHHIQLGATRDGRLTALRHEGWEVTSRPSQYNVSGTETTARIYACPNILTKVNIVHADRNTPGFMRAPPETPYMFALETAMDELAVSLGMDPVELRRVNEPERDPATGKPFSSRSLMPCFDQGAERFGWKRRNPSPGAMREGEWLVGWGCAAAAYPANIGPAACRVTLTAEGRARVQIAAHDIGTGAYTAIAITAADRLGLELGQVLVELGGTELPAAGLAAGSSHTAGICNAVAKACEGVRQRLAQAAVTSNEGKLAGLDPASLTLSAGALRGPGGAAEALPKALARAAPGALEVYAENIPQGLPPESIGKVYQGQMAMSRGHSREDATTYTFGAQFVEVRVHELTREIRVPRAVGAFAAGTIVNPLTAYSQYMGGMIWGIGAALHEATEIDPHAARYVNDNIAEYLIPVNADVRSIEVIMVPEQDSQVNPLGIKGIGEIGIVGMNAAISNAVWHATGRRIRELPIRIEDLL